MILFKARFQVQRHGSKKNQKKIYRNKRTGRMFIGSEIKTKALENSLVNKLIQEKRQNGLETINCDIHVKLLFYFPRSTYLTAKGARAQRLGDIDNLISSVLDPLTKSSVIKDDSFICSLDGSRRLMSEDEHFWLVIEISTFNE